jgi:hypothetical protein
VSDAKTGNGQMIVILDDSKPLPFIELAGPLAKGLRRVRFDVLNKLKRDPYIPVDKLSGAEAQIARGCFEKAGVQVAVLEMSQMPADPKIFTVHNADVEDQGLSIQTDFSGSMRLMGWDQFDVIELGVIAETSTPMGFSAGNIQEDIQAAQLMSRMQLGVGANPMAGLRHKAHVNQSKTDTYEVLCIMPRDTDIEIRARSNQFNYDYLLKRKTLNSDANFRLLVSDLAGRVTYGMIGTHARRFLDSDALPAAVSKRDLLRHNLWLRLRARAGL